MTISDWFIGTCGGSHIGIYVCSRCGYEILRSSFEKNFVLKSPNLTSALPLPVTVAAAKGQPKDEKSGSRIESSKPFNNNMLKDFTKNAILGKTFHKDSLVQKIVESGKPENQQVKYDVGVLDVFYITYKNEYYYLDF